MARRKPLSDAAASVLARMADRLDSDHPDGEMTKAARIGLVCLFIPGQPDLLDDVLPAAPGVSPGCSRREYAAVLRFTVRSLR